MDTRGLALAWLAGRPEAGATLGALSAALAGREGGRLSDRVELVSTLETLESDGLVALDTDDGVRCRLTDAGREAGARARERLLEERVTVADGGREDLSVAAAAERVDRSPVTVAATATDGVYYGETTPEWELVGREDELAAVAECRRAVGDDGEGRAVLLAGPPGVGKTALAERALADCEGFDVLRSRARGEGAAPYQPLRDLLADLPATPFADVGPEAQDSEALQAQQAALFADVTAALAPGPDESPRAVLLDDLHLADGGTLSYLDHLLSRLEEHRLLVLGGYRPAEQSGDAPIAAGAVDDTPGVTRLELSPLAREGTRRLVEGTLETRDPPAGFVAAVQERTGGTPLFVEETVAALAETGQVDPDLGVYPDSAAAIDVPAAVEETIEHRVSQFPDPARDLLRWAAVLGEGFDAGVLVAVADLSETAVRTYLDAFVDGAVFDRDGDRLTFRSEVVREALLSDLDAEERRRRHGRIAAVLERNRDDGEEAAAALAYHHERTGNRERAIAAYREAARRAREVYAHETAVEHLQSALALAREYGDEARMVEVALTLSKLYGHSAAYDRAERFAQFARETATTPDRRARALARLAGTANGAGDSERALALVEEGLAVETDAAATLLLEVQASAQQRLGRYEAARETAGRLRRLAAERDEPEREMAALTTLAVVARRQGDPQRAREHYRTALEHGRETGQRLIVATALQGLGDVAHRLGDLEGAAEHLEAALSINREIGDRRGVGNCLNSLGLLADDRDDHEGAREYYEQRLALAREVGDRRGAASTLNNLGMTAHRQGDHERAREHLEEALSVSREIGATHGLARCLGNLGRVAAALGDTDRAGERFEAAAAQFESVGDGAAAASVRFRFGELADPEHGGSDPGAARDRYRTALETANEAGEERVVSVSMVRLAALAFDAGDREEAFATGDHALDRIGARHLLLPEADVLGELCRLVEAAERAGYEARAHEWAHRAADALGAAPVDAPDWLVERTTGRLGS